jgi:hypothetical protein
MPLKLRKNNSLELGNVYSYEGKNYLIIRSDYEKSKAYEISNLDDVGQLQLSMIKNFYNEDAELLAKPKLTKKIGKNFKIGDFIMQDGLIYILDEVNASELIFTDFPKTNCPIYFFSPLDTALTQLKMFVIAPKKTEEELAQEALELEASKL